MNQLIFSALNQIVSNKHTSGAAVAYAASKFGCPLLAVWFPTKKAEIEATGQYLEAAAVFYGFAAAGDSSKSATKKEVAAVASAVQTGDTSMIPKSVSPETIQKPMGTNETK